MNRLVAWGNTGERHAMFKQSVLIPTNDEELLGEVLLFLNRHLWGVLIGNLSLTQASLCTKLVSTDKWCSGIR